MTLTDLLISNWPLRVYWSVFLFLLVFAVVVSVGKKRKDHLFLVLIFGEIVLVTLLFLYWSWRITGRMYNFNGYFFFAIQLLAALALSAFYPMSQAEVSTGALKSPWQAHRVHFCCLRLSRTITIAVLTFCG